LGANRYWMSMSQTDTDDRITVYSDYVCPFCYLGRESLQRYQDTRDEELEVDWRPFDLRSGKRNPDGSIDHSVDDGKDEDYYEQAKEGVRRLQAKYDVEMELDLASEIDSLRQTVHEQFSAAQRQGITGVPTFAYEGYAARGAGPPEHLERLVEGN